MSIQSFGIASGYTAKARNENIVAIMLGWETWCRRHWVVVAQTKIIARKLPSGQFEVYKVETGFGEFYMVSTRCLLRSLALS